MRSNLWAKGRGIGGWGGVKRWVAQEDGKHIRGMTQDVDSVVKHVKAMNDKHNNGRGRTAYKGSIPWPLQDDWRRKNHYTWGQIARNEDHAKDKMMKHFSGPEYRKLFANDYKAPR